MKGHAGTERRKARRINANLVISYRVREERRNYDLSQSKNLSQGGMLLTTNRKIESGTLLVMTILFPFLDNKIEVNGEVVESREVVKGLIYETSIKFADLRDQLAGQLDDFIKGIRPEV